MTRRCIERTRYFAKPGKAAEVLETRREASRVRVEIGLPHGRIVTPGEGSDTGADVEWEHCFADRAEREADMAARAASPAFEAVRKRMGALIDNFERLVLEVEADPLAVHDLTDWPMAPEEVTFDGPRGRLTGFLYRPPGEPPFRCMVVNHGSTVTPDSTDICKPSVAAALAQWGIACLFPNRWGYGRSPGKYWREEVTTEYGTPEYDAQLLARLDAEADDVVAARAFAAFRPEIDGGRIGVMGSSFGGTVSLLAGAKEPGFACMIDFAGAAMNWEKAPGLAAHMKAAAASLTQPSFFIQADNDYSIGPTRDIVKHLEGSALPVWSRIFPGFGLTKDEGHLFERHGTMIWGPHVRVFLDRYL
ncbi:MAG: dienelactone hydrolase family protein [Azospirillaceae bacterium]